MDMGRYNQYIDTVKKGCDQQVNTLSERIKVVFLSVFMWGILAHGYMFFNKLSFHDDTARFWGADGNKLPISEGRWMWALYENVYQSISGFDHSISEYKGFISLLFIGIALIVISSELHISKRINLVVLSGAMVTNTTITCLFGYMYMAILYSASLMLSVFACTLIHKFSSKLYIFFAIVLFVCSIGTYQLFFCTGLCTLFIYFVHDTIQRKPSWKAWGRQLAKYSLFFGISVILYVFITKIVCLYCDVELVTLHGTDNMGIVDFKEYIQRVKITYLAFIRPNSYIMGNPFPQISNYLYRGFIILYVGCFSWMVLKNYKSKKYCEALQEALCLILSPIVFNFIFVLIGESYNLTNYCLVFLFILWIDWCENCSFGIWRIKRCFEYGGVVPLHLLGHLSMIFDAKWQNFCVRKIPMPMLV